MMPASLRGVAGWDVAGYGVMWRDVEGCGGMWREVVEGGGVWWDVGGMWRDVAGGGRLWWHGEIRRSMMRHVRGATRLQLAGVARRGV
jgi:hypothetical protein